MRVKQISVKGLFNTFNHVIPLNLDDRLTIIHGPNGFGKTILFNLLERLFNNEPTISPSDSILVKIPFTEFQVDFENESCLRVTKIKDHINNWPKDKFQNTIPVSLIDTQKRVSLDQTQMIGTVSKKGKHLAELIKSKLAESARLSQSLERTFPRRLIEPNASSINLEGLRQRLEALEKKRSRLKTSGILDDDEDFAFQLPEKVEEQTKQALLIYLQDAEKKLEVFDELYQKIRLFQDIINQRFLYKQMTINKEAGFVFTNYHGDEIALTDLSLGEQHELVMLYELLFKTKPNSLILIDEPEISLHVLWESQFLEDLQKIMQLVSFDVLIATHSPAIINDRWDLTVELKGPKKT